MTGGCRVFLVYRPQMGFSQTKNGTRSISSSTQTSSKIVVFMLQTFFSLEIGPSSSYQTNIATLANCEFFLYYAIGMKNDIKRPPLTGELKQVPSLSPTTLAISKFRKLFWVTYRFHTCSSWLFCCQFSFKMVYCSFEEKYFSDLRGKPLFDESGPLSELKITANDSNIFIIYLE